MQVSKPITAGKASKKIKEASAKSFKQTTGDKYMELMDLVYTTEPLFSDEIGKKTSRNKKRMDAKNNEKSYKAFRDKIIESKLPDKEKDAMLNHLHEKWEAPTKPNDGVDYEERIRVLQFLKSHQNELRLPYNYFEQRGFLNMSQDLQNRIRTLMKKEVPQWKKESARVFAREILLSVSPFPLPNINDQDQMSTVYSLMMYFSIRSTVKKSIERLIYEAFESVMDAEAHRAYMKNIMEFRKGNLPSFMVEMQILGVIQGINFMKDVYIGEIPILQNNLNELYLYLLENPILSAGICAAMKIFPFPPSPPVMNVFRLSKICQTDINIQKGLMPIMHYFDLIELFISCYEDIITEENAITREGVVIEIMVESLLRGTEYSEWFRKKSDIQWWEGSYRF